MKGALSGGGPLMPGNPNSPIAWLPVPVAAAMAAPPTPATAAATATAPTVLRTPQVVMGSTVQVRRVRPL
ncbi:hypothetical protein TUM20983_13660 [Mycobacterium antarcticum]|nr:hypothetical protein TUM20983_13660 [Mycolicibacterium sp. TUM20983]GLP80052.1 hypothetical protein TUM20984_14720 [Mycolicibacterium sp. TUM20984]